MFLRNGGKIGKAITITTMTTTITIITTINQFQHRCCETRSNVHKATALGRNLFG
jgi:hypothetical protein